MQVYGDHDFEEAPADALRALGKRMEGWRGPGDAGELVSMLVDAGTLVQGLLDFSFHERGDFDEQGPWDEECETLLEELAGAVVSSWRGARVTLRPSQLEPLLRQALPARIRMRLPEGFVFYGLFPEAWAEAAKALPSGEVQCIGLRSIGVTLAAVMRAATGSSRPLVTLRPTGHPFFRQVHMGPELERRLCAGPQPCAYAIADEGPGLSGSSFAAVGSWLEAHGIPPGRIHFFPSHAGEPGAAASVAARGVWQRVHRHPGGCEEVLARKLGAQPLPLEEVSGGHWRAKLFDDPAQYPAVHPQQERRKFLLREDGRTSLLKFAGLGRWGERAFQRARQLAEAGFSPPALGLRHGFLIQPWLEDARPLSVRAVDRERLLERVGAYLGFRARTFASPEASGAPVRALYQMTRINILEALGDEAAEAVARLEAGLPGLEREWRRIETDNRLQQWEWLVQPDGQILKTDAVDHCLGHDLIGSQDPAWDFAGAKVELGLSAEELEKLIERAAVHGAPRPSARALHFCELAYLAFQLGHQTMAADSTAAQDPEEAARLRTRANACAQMLRAVLGAG